MASGKDPTLEERRQECEDLVAQSAAREAITPGEQARFDALLQEFPQLRREHDELVRTIALAQQHSVPKRTESESNRLETQILSQVQAKAVPPRTSMSTVVAGYIRSHGFRAVGIAAVFVCGVGIGRWFVPSLQVQEQPVVTAKVVASSKETAHIETQTFLNDAHLLMIGVMAMNAECGVANPRTLAAQRERCLELMARAEQMNRALQLPAPAENSRQFAERARLRRLVGEIEFALAGFAAADPAAMHGAVIRHIQERTDYALCEVSSALEKE